MALREFLILSRPPLRDAACGGSLRTRRPCRRTNGPHPIRLRPPRGRSGGPKQSRSLATAPARLRRAAYGGTRGLAMTSWKWRCRGDACRERRLAAQSGPRCAPGFGGSVDGPASCVLMWRRPRPTPRQTLAARRLGTTTRQRLASDLPEERQTRGHREPSRRYPGRHVAGDLPASGLGMAARGVREKPHGDPSLYRRCGPRAA